MLLSMGGANVNAKDKEGTNSLMAAAAMGSSGSHQSADRDQSNQR
jgi:hypothetical protein